MNEITELDTADAADVEVIADVNDYADETTALGCGDSNPYT